MAVVEFIILFVSVYVAAILSAGDISSYQQAVGPLAPRAAVMATVMLLCLIAMGLYHFHQRIYFREAAARVLVGVAAGSLALAAIFYALPSVVVSREIAFYSVIFSLIFLLLTRYYFINTVDENVFRRRILVYGSGKRAASISDLRRRADRRGFRVVGKVLAAGDSYGDHTDSVITDSTSICKLASERQADEIVIAMDDRRGNLPIRELLDCRLRGIEVIDLLEFLERETGKIRVDLVSPGWLIFAPGFRVSRFRLLTKRVVDVLASLVMLAASLPGRRLACPGVLRAGQGGSQRPGISHTQVPQHA